MTPDRDLFMCSYCLNEKPVDERSDEHIWPEALGGDPLGPPWRTENVCHRCNTLAGLWVDGAFIRSFFGSHERATDAEAYLDPRHPEKAVAQFIYMATVEPEELRADETAEVWIGPAGEHVLHVRPRHDEVWNTFAGGKPTRKRAESGHAYLSFTSPEPYWVHVALWSFQRQFRYARRTLVNANTPEMASPLTPISPDDSEQARHLRMAASLTRGAEGHMVVDLDYSTRFLCKLALGVGREVLGDAYLRTPYAGYLSRALKEANFAARQTIPVKGSAFFGGLTASLERLPLKWPGAWVLILLPVGNQPGLVVVTPSGKMMAMLVSDDAEVSAIWRERFDEGEVYLAVPAAAEAIGPVPFPDYLAFITDVADHPELRRLCDLRGDPDRLPPKRLRRPDEDGSR